MPDVNSWSGDGEFQEILRWLASPLRRHRRTVIRVRRPETTIPEERPW